MFYRRHVHLILALFWSTFVVGAQATQLVIGGSGADLGTMTQLAEAFSLSHPEIRVEVLRSLGSSGGIRAAAKGRIQIGLASRGLKEKEKKLPIDAYHYARTPMVLATSKRNPADTISRQDYLATLQGRKVYWADGQLMRIVLRPVNDSDTQMLQRYFPEAAELIGAASLERGRPIALSDQIAADSLEQITGSVGTSTLSLIKGENRELKALTLDGVEPNVENLRNGDYQLAKDLFLVVGKKHDPTVELFLDFIGSSTASGILERTGHEVIPLTAR